MASRVILRKKRNLLFNHFISQHTSVILGFSSVGIGQPFESSELDGLSRFPFSSSATTGHGHDSHEHGRERNMYTVNNDDLEDCSASRFYLHNYFGGLNFGNRTEKIELVSLSRLGWTFQSVRNISTASANQSSLGSNSGGNGNEKSDTKQKKEASPEECDEAVEDLSTIKAKAKAKQLQEPHKSTESIVKKFWAMILGIGPAFRAILLMSRNDWAKKLSHWKDEFKSTLQHYWFGTKLLWADVRISSRLLLKLANGKSLSRRERQQLTRTTIDIFRLVPFAVFIIVPFMEILLPVFLKLFPNMLPSTFQDKMKEQEALKRRLNARIEYAKFLQDTVKEMAKEVQNSRSGEMKKTAEDLDEFMNKVRTGARVSNDEILGFAKLFNDEFTLDNISRPRLVNMCKYMGISPYGTDTYLRYMLRKRLQEIKNDDKLIQEEGVEALSEAELRQACRDRGLLGLRSVEEMRQQLNDWLDLSLNHSLPSSLLILSRISLLGMHSHPSHSLCRAFSVTGKVKPEEVVQATLSSLPDEVVDTVGVTALPSEDSVSERKRKLEYLEMQEELIKEEEEKQAKVTESIGGERNLATKEVAPTTEQTREEIKAKALEKHEQLCEISQALVVLASASSVSKEREEFLRLVKKEMELYNSMVRKEGGEGEQEAKKAYRAARKDSDGALEVAISDKVSSALVDKVDAMLQTLEKEIDDVDAKIGDRWRLLDRDYDGKVTPEEVVSAAMYLKDTLGKEGIQELISNLSKDIG
ncbi:putative EF-hand domain pair, letm1 ribosome-binding domain-containing protein [Medicago truncatula]|uniref:Putative EF-hand domain pair, letm1 ribosome-binding domain-containing protein n=1 Tax=Medicago truncatula TaxID=3880 RepID=A0A396H1M4_MEDTR|nr:putative EF-hand domain pair, letm1 ribosome-binding domain-containing protein [Medicago truncatula]